MFKVITQNPDTLKWPVVVEVPQDGGKTRKWEFTGTFKRLNADEKEALDKDIEDQTDWVERYVKKTMGIMVGWEDVCDEDGNPLPYSRESLRAAVRSTYGNQIMIGINRAIAQYESGSKAKN